MDAVAKAMKAMVEQMVTDCEFASQESLEAWAASDAILAIFAQKELVYRDQQRVIDAMPEGATNG